MRRNVTWDMRKFLPDSEFSMRESMIEAVLTTLTRTSTPPNIVGTTAVAASTNVVHEKRIEPNPDFKAPSAVAAAPLPIYRPVTGPPESQVDDTPAEGLGGDG